MSSIKKEVIKQTTMKIIFLDIDGVLNHEIWFKSKEYALQSKQVNLLHEKNLERASKEAFDVSMIDPEKVSLLNSLVKDTDAKVVVSSSWRKNRTVEELEYLLNELLGLQAEIIGKTPILDFQPLPNQDYSYSVPRGCEIKAWLEINKGILGVKMSKVKYVILDDDSDFLYWQRHNYIRVDRYCGLTSTNTHLARQILND